MIPWQPLNFQLAGLQSACSCFLPESKTTALAGSQAVAVSRDVLALVPYIQLGVCEPVATPVCLKWPRAPGHMQTHFLDQCGDIDLFWLSGCLFQGKFYICTACVTTSKFRNKGLRVGKLGSARHPRACLPGTQQSRFPPQATAQLQGWRLWFGFPCSGNRCLAWKVAFLPFSFYWNHRWCHVWDCASHRGVAQALPQSVTCHVELLFYRIIRTDSAPDILSPIAVAFGLQSGLNYTIVFLTLPSTAPSFIIRVTDHSAVAESTAFL